MTRDDRPPTRAVAYYRRTGVILPGHQGDVAAYVARDRDDTK